MDLAAVKETLEQRMTVYRNKLAELRQQVNDKSAGLLKFKGLLLLFQV